MKLDRRKFLVLSGAAAGSVALGDLLDPLSGADLVGSQVLPDGTQVIPVVCNHNCGGRCVLTAHVKDGVLVRITTDDSADSAQSPQLRACLRGRATRNRLYHPDRLKYPMKRTGRRGEGRFERISWDQAIELIAFRLKSVVDRFGPASVYIQYGTGDGGAISGVSAARRLMNLMGGYLGYYGSYSSACLRYTAPYVVGYRDTSSYRTLEHSRLIILNGFNPAETIFETNSNLYLSRAKDAGAKVVAIDPRLTDTAAAFADQWLPIRPTTDAALFAAMAYVMVKEDLQDQSFLDRYCLGFDEEHMPPGIPPGNSYRSYLLGMADGQPKTPEWGAVITGIDAQAITNLAREYARIRPAQLIQGLGPQRHACGEQSVRAGITLACMTGNLGILGGGYGGGDGGRNLGVEIGALPTGVNPVKTRISFFTWTDAIVRGTEMTEADGVQNGPLPSNIKFIFNIASNVLINQHADIHRTSRILEDQGKVEFIVVSDQFMTPSARFADVLLPSDHALERNDLGFPWSGEKYVILGSKAVEAPYECRHDYWWLSRVADRLGLGARFTEGKTQEDWLRQLIDEARKSNPALPSYEDLRRTGIYREEGPPYVAFEREIRDPLAHPFRTPSGKIEIFSKTLYDMNRPADIPAVPKYVAAWEGPADPLTARFPLQCIGPHYRRRTHSTFDETPWMEEADPQTMWISPTDAQARNITEGSRVKVFNDRGALVIRAHITRRMRPGVVAIPQGAWYTPDKEGVCQRGCVNVLTSQRPTALAHGNAQHTVLVEMKRV